MYTSAYRCFNFSIYSLDKYLENLSLNLSANNINGA